MTKSKQTIKLSNLDKINKAYEMVKKLDKETIQLDKMALTLATKKCKLSLTMVVTDLETNKEEKIMFDEDGDIVPPDYIEAQRRMVAHHFGVHTSMIQVMNREEIKNKSKLTLKESVEETTGLSLLGIVLGYKQRQRKELLKQLKAMGIDV